MAARNERRPMPGNPPPQGGPPRDPMMSQPGQGAPGPEGDPREQGMQDLIELIMTHPEMAPIREAVFAKMQQQEGEGAGPPPGAGSPPPAEPMGPPPGMPGPNAGPPQGPPGPPPDSATPFLDAQRRRRQPQRG